MYINLKVFCSKCRRWFGQHTYDCIIDRHMEQAKKLKAIAAGNLIASDAAKPYAILLRPGESVRQLNRPPAISPYPRFISQPKKEDDDWGFEDDDPPKSAS